MALLKANTGIGTTNPTSALHVIGDVLVTGVVTATAFNGNINVGIATIANINATNLNVTGLSTVVTLSGTTLNYPTAYVNTGIVTNISGTNLNYTGVGTITNLIGTNVTYNNAYIQSGIVTNISGTNLNYTGVGTIVSLVATNSNLVNLNVTGITTLGVTTATHLNVQSVNSSGIITGSTFRPSTGYIQAADGTNSFYIFDSTGNVAFQGTIGASQINNSQGYKVIGFNSQNDITFENHVYTAGITTSVGGFVGNLTGIAASATQLLNSRTFEITGDVVAPAVSFDGTGNVILNSTIQPNSVGLGTDTFGDYVKNITGTTGQVTVTGGDGEGSTPVIGLPNDVTIANNLIVSNDLQVNSNLNVNGNITIGGTSSYIAADSLTVKDKDIILGVSTGPGGTDLSTDTTANHGGVAIASTEGSPLVSLQVVGINTLPETYKQMMWVKSGTMGAGTTDAWLFNYGVGIGSTQVPNGVRLAVGAVQITDNGITAQNSSFTNSSGTNLYYVGVGTIVTLTGSTLTYDNAYIRTGIITDISGTNLNYTGVGTITNLIGTNVTYNNAYIQSGIVTDISGTNLNYTGVSTITNLNGSNVFYTGISTLTNLIGTNVTYNNGYIQTGIVTNISGTNLNYTGVSTITNLSGTDSNYTNATITNLIGTAGTITTLNSTTGTITTLYGTNVSYTNANVLTGIVTNISGTNLNYTGVGTVATLNSTTGTITTLYGTNASYGTVNALVGIITNISGTNLNYTGVATFLNGPVLIGSGTSTGTASQRLQVTGGSYISGNVGLGNTNPLYPLSVTNTGTQSLTSLSNCLADFTTNADSYGQVNIRNASTGTNASSDLIITTDNGSDTTNYLDLGINNSGFSTSTWTINGANDAYLYSSSSNLSIGVATSKYISFFTGGTLSSNEKARIDILGNFLVNTQSATGTTNQLFQVNSGVYIAGNLGLGNTNPLSKLTVTGDGNFSGVITATAFNGNINAGIATITTLNVTNVTNTNINSTGIITATQFSTGAVGSAINITNNSITGPSSIVIDPAAVGDDTGAVRIKGDLYVDGTQFIINSSTIELADFNVGIATTVTSNNLLDGAGIGIGASSIRKTLTYDFTNAALKSSENFNIPTGKTYKINGVDVLSSTTLGTGVVNSSLTSVGTLGQLNVSGITTSSRLNVGTGGTVVTTTLGPSRVGINSTSPGYTLDVGGDINFSGTLYNNGIKYVSGVGIYSGGNIISGAGTTIINFVGSAVSSIVTNSATGITTVILDRGAFNRTTTSFTATSGQTTFTLNYTPGFIDVYVNGVRLTAAEYVATNGTSVVILTGCFAGDIVDITAFNDAGLFSSSKWTPGNGDDIYRLNGGVGIGTNSPNSTLDLQGILGINAITTGISTTVATTISSISASVFRSARYQIQITQGSFYQSTDLMAIHDGTNADLIEYGSIATGDYLGSFSAIVSGGSLLLQITMNSASSATIKVARYGITV